MIAGDIVVYTKLSLFEVKFKQWLSTTYRPS
jgi:hypothetical protein